jgi:hypothetical protein
MLLIANVLYRKSQSQAAFAEVCDSLAGGFQPMTEHFRCRQRHNRVTMKGWPFECRVPSRRTPSRPQACLSRGKPRDFYDLYFILRSRMAFKEIFAKDKTIKKKLLEKIARERLDLRYELRRFLPVSQHRLLKNFKSVLTAELEKNLP